METATVADLIDANTRQWNHEVIDGVFAQEEATFIMKIPLGRIASEDILIWPYSPDGTKFNSDNLPHHSNKIFQLSKDKKRWKPPPADLVKINFDGATCSGTNKSGLGVVIRDSMGQVLASCSKVVNQAHSSSEVEAMAAGLVLSFAAELGVKNAVLEGDSLLVVKALTDSESSMSPIGPLINDAKYNSYSFEKLLF
nr:uncharacterized protein LOC112024645 [Quercus suber]